MDVHYIQEQEIVSLNEICRACLIKTDNMKNLLTPGEESVQLISKLSSVSNLEIDINEAFPCFLCHSCEEKLKISYDFQQLVQKSHQFILTCLSATDTIEVNIFKPLKLLGNIEQIEVPLEPPLESSSNDFINFIDDTGLQTEVQASYKEDSAGKAHEEIKEDEKQANSNIVDSNRDEDFIKIDNGNISEEINNDEDFIKPREVERRTKNNQTMRLAQYSPEEIDKLIKKTRERFFKHINCLYCGFTAKYSRSLSVHMTRLHKEMKEQWCPWCNKIFSNLDEHIKVDHKDNFKCPLCGKRNGSTGHFLEHLASHSIERKHICRLCEKCFISARHLKMHFNKVHGNDKPYICQFCLKGFMLLKSLKVHLKSHKKHQCKICEEVFGTSKQYDEHKCFNKHGVEEKGQRTDGTGVEDKLKIVPQNFCVTCNRKVKSLQSHIDKCHSDKSTGKLGGAGALCTYCGKQFRSISKLTVHVRIHTGETPYKCSYCDKRMTTRIHLIVHERTHTGEKPYICKICGKGFAQSSVLNTHMKLHTGRPEVCTICLKRFCRPSALRQHMRMHTGEKPFLCVFCGQAFKQKSHLVEHNKTHNSERPFKCEYCKKGFKQSGTLKSHINIHLGKKPFKCSQCSYSCRQSYCLTQHMSRHENNHHKPERPHRCVVCDLSFTTLAKLSSHYSNKHGSFEMAGATSNDSIPTKNSIIEVTYIQGDTVLENL